MRTPARVQGTRSLCGFPFQLPKGDKPEAYYAALIRTPFGDDATLDFARAAIEGENLGRNPAGVPDLLGVSLSTCCAWTARSPASSTTSTSASGWTRWWSRSPPTTVS